MKPEPTKVTVELAGGKRLSIRTGKLPKQAHGAAVVRFGDNVIFATAVESRAPRRHRFFPADRRLPRYTYAGGRIPGGFIKREGRPSEREILTSRQIDRPVRPLFRGRIPLRDAGYRACSLRRYGKRSRRCRHQCRLLRTDHFGYSISWAPRGGARWPDGRKFHHQSHLYRDARRPAQHHGGRHRRRHRHDRIRRERSEGRDGSRCD